VGGKSWNYDNNAETLRNKYLHFMPSTINAIPFNGLLCEATFLEQHTRKNG
jgi:hypothetical protein